MVWAGVIIVYILNIFFKKSSEQIGRSNKENPYEDSEALENPFEEIRREILRKKGERKGLEEAKTEVSMEAEEAQPIEFERNVIEIDEPKQFQVHLEEQALQIKQKQEEANRLQANLAQIKNDQRSGASLKSHASAVDNSAKVSKRVRSVLGKKNDLKAALIAGEILAQPLALRKGNSASAQF